MKDCVFEERNVLFFQKMGIAYATVRLTENILKHSIFDANRMIRSFLREQNIHDFEEQKFGKDHKIFLDTYILTFSRSIETKTSLYRAETRGDCRMWFGNTILSLAEPEDLFIITSVDKVLYVINVSKIDLELCYQTSYYNQIKELIKRLLFA